MLADKMNLSDKTISKWERGLGCPDVSLLNELSAILNVNIEEILNGDLSENDVTCGNMMKSKYYFCNDCKNIIISTGDAMISCCGRKLKSLSPKKANDNQKLKVETVEDEWFISSDHPMDKDHYISFVALACGDKLQVYKTYPEWNLSLRIPIRNHGMLLWYSVKDGLFYQLI